MHGLVSPGIPKLRVPPCMRLMVPSTATVRRMASRATASSTNGSHTADVRLQQLALSDLQSQPHKVSQRVQDTDAPIIVATKALMATTSGVLSLAQGIVHWQPPVSSLQAAADAATRPDMQGYGPCEGSPALRDALRVKIQQENGLHGAFVNLVLSLVDATDRVVLFAPYYFNHLMALQMTGGADTVVMAPCCPDTLRPDLDWLERYLADPANAAATKMVVIINPNNPTGVLLDRPTLQRAADLTQRAGSWLVMDNTYEHFVYDGREHHCVAGDHIIHVFSFSKAYGMMGWRVGYIAYPAAPGGVDSLGPHLLKVQDTIPICTAQLPQLVALKALEEGRGWVTGHVQGLQGNRRAVLEALAPLGDRVVGGEGAIYFWARLPDGCEDDQRVVEWLVKRHKVCIIPGSSCGAPGFVRVAFANLDKGTCAEACRRLHAGLTELTTQGAAVLDTMTVPN